MPAFLASEGVLKFTKLPSKKILPDVGISTPVICLINVDLPAPLSPTIAICSPFWRVKSALSNAYTPP